jgi:hypothetical protein
MKTATAEQNSNPRPLGRGGCQAVVVFYPEELGDANPRRLEDRLCELGVECISDLQD